MSYDWVLTAIVGRRRKGGDGDITSVYALLRCDSLGISNCLSQFTEQPGLNNPAQYHCCLSQTDVNTTGAGLT